MKRIKARGRPRAFDPRAALDQVTNVFWEKGYDATTYEALEAATGCRRQSLIYVFGDKQSMFLKVLDHYVSTRVAAVCKDLKSAQSAKLGIEVALASWRADAQRSRRRGCLMVTAASEVGPHNPLVAERIAVARHKLVQAFAQAFECAEREGSLRHRVTHRQLAELTVSAADGCLLHARNEASPRSAKSAFEALHQLLFR